MIRNPRPKNSWLTAVLVIAAVGLWIYQETQSGSAPRGTGSSPGASSSSPSQKVAAPATKGAQSTRKVEKVGAYEFYQGCTLVDARNNDGDSFLVRLPDGKNVELRLYFVDTPESAFKNYGGGETNHPRIRQQAADLGGITPEQAVEIGKKGKSFTLGLLSSRPFGIYTAWDSPYQDNRYHAFVEVVHDGKSRWLSELLVERGLARLKTKPADLPDGTPASKQTARLRDLERAAKRAELGAWGL
jgi:endonuclease YncB( thermonuclease family)